MAESVGGQGTAAPTPAGVSQPSVPAGVTGLKRAPAAEDRSSDRPPKRARIADPQAVEALVARHGATFHAYTDEQKKQIRRVFLRSSTGREDASELIQKIAAYHPAFRTDDARFMATVATKLREGAEAKPLPFPLRYGAEAGRRLRDRPRSRSPSPPRPVSAPARPAPVAVNTGLDASALAFLTRRWHDAMSALINDADLAACDSLYDLFLRPGQADAYASADDLIALLYRNKHLPHDVRDEAAVQMIFDCIGCGSSYRPPAPDTHYPEKTAKTEGTCIVCMDQPVNAVLVPCGHMATCFACGQALMTPSPSREAGCLICRAPISFVMRVFRVTDE
jgi:hypothetical protein